MKAPCKDCEERFLGCHSQCEKYQEFNRRLIQARKARLDRSEQDHYVKCVIDRIIRKKMQREGKI